MTSTVVFTAIESPFGDVRIAWNEAGLVSVSVGPQAEMFPPDPAWRFERRTRSAAVEQIEAYFNGRLRRFELPLVLIGTEFQKRVWRALADIPYGRTISYADLARRVGAPKAFRAVGAANGRNPLPIVLPCHRVVASDGSLGGYAGGVDLKRALLEFERKFSRSSVPSPAGTARTG